VRETLWHGAIKPILAIIGFILLFLFVDKANAQPYVRTFDAIRTVNVATSAELSAAINSAQPGDVLLLQDGSIFNIDISIKNPDLMIKCNGHCVIDGAILLDAPNVWLWGIEIKTHAYKSINFFSANGGIINCVIHGDGGQDQVGVFTAPVPLTPDNVMVIYGNIIYDEQYAAYVQNTEGSPKYIVNNVMTDIVYPSLPYVIHNYSQTENRVQDIHYFDNVISTGTILNGGQGAPPDNYGTPPINIEFKGNILYATGSQGFKRPFNLQFVNNYIFKSPLINDFIWGVGEGWFSYPPQPFTVTGNKIYNPGQQQVYYRTSRYPGFNLPREDGVSKFRASDVIDSNEYYGGFSGGINADNTNTSTTDINQWRNITQNAGNRFDNSSTVFSNAPSDSFSLKINEYDNSRATLAVWKFSGANAVNITLPKAADIFAIKNTYGAPIASLPSGQSSFPQSTEFGMYLVKFKDNQPICDIPFALNALNIAKTYIQQAKKKKALTAINSAIDALNECEQ